MKGSYLKGAYMWAKIEPWNHQLAMDRYQTRSFSAFIPPFFFFQKHR